MAGGYQGEGFSDVPGWRISILFIMFVVLTIAWDRSIRFIEHFLRRRKFKALRHAFRHLQNELLVLGFLSLVLVALEPLLVKACIPGGSAELDAAKNSTTAPSPAPSAVGSTAELAMSAQGGSCGAGKEPIWSAKLIYQTHLFLFILGVCYTIYACLTLFLCILKVRSWGKFEKDVIREPERRWPLDAELSGRDLRVCTPGWGKHFVRCFFGQFTESVNEGTFSAIRWLFIIKNELPWEFDFQYYVTESMEEDVTGVLSMEWFLLLLTAGVLLVMNTPIRFYILSVLSGSMLLLVLFLGTKLESIQGTLARMSADYQDSKESVHRYDVQENGRAVPVGNKEAPEYRVSEHRTERISEDFLKDNKILHKLFWVSRPTILLRLFQLVFFVISLNISIILFASWQFPNFIQKNTGGVIALVVTLVVDFGIVVLEALYIIPVYALVAVCGEDFNPKMSKRMRRAMSREGSMLSMSRQASVVSRQASVVSRQASAVTSVPEE